MVLSHARQFTRRRTAHTSLLDRSVNSKAQIPSASICCWCTTSRAGNLGYNKLYNTLTLILTLIYPASNWTLWATLRRHPCLSRAATFTFSQVNPIFCKSLLTVPLQFVRGRLSSLLYSNCLLYVVWYKKKHMSTNIKSLQQIDNILTCKPLTTWRSHGVWSINYATVENEVTKFSS